MRLLPGLIFVILVAAASPVEARLFRQTFGATVPAADGCGCAWNLNQDYFVPRYPSSGRYGLFSPCKASWSTSPACRGCHPIHQGYCTIYGPCHYHRRNHVYSVHCGCSPIQFDCGGVCGARPAASCCATAGSRGGACCETQAALCTELCPEAPLYNVEPAHLDILGSIPIEGGDLLTRTDFSQLGNERNGKLSLPLQDTLPLLQGLPSLGLPPSELLKHLPKP